MYWVAVHTKARKEQLADFCLAQEGYKTLWLHYEDTRRHAGREDDILRSYFPRYLFARVLPEQSVYRINKTLGVSTVVYAGDDPLEIPLCIIKELRTRGNKNGLIGLPPEEKEQRKRLERGMEIRLVDGPLIGFIATVELDSGKEISIWLKESGIIRRATVPPEHISPGWRRYS